MDEGFLGMGISLRRHQGPERAMTTHTDPVHVLLELYASQGVTAAKPLSEQCTIGRTSVHGTQPRSPGMLMVQQISERIPDQT